MMNTKEIDKDIAKEILTIILYTSREIQDKIPEKVIKELTNLAADSKKEIYLEKNKIIYEQPISKEALDYFSVIYCLYVADIKEKDDIINKWIKNEKIS